MACVYIDVNGLHELNNTKGHDAGDTMLKTVAQQIRNCFGAESAYRIGGDELILFVPDKPAETVDRMCCQLAETLEKEKYYISVGVQWEENVTSFSALIRAAEKKMYMAKKTYYEKEVNNKRKEMRE